MVQSGSHIKKHILGFLQQKRAALFDDIIVHVESNTDDQDRKVDLKYIVARSIKNMAKAGDLTTHDTPNSSYARITPSGRHTLRSLRLSDNTHLMPAGWDGKWRMVILDVPESDKEKRNALRYILKKAKFVCLKNSVWISPYPFEHMFQNMKEDLGLSDELMIVVTDSLDDTSEAAFRESYWK